MRLEPVLEPSDPRIEPFRALKEGDLVLRQGLFIAEGLTVVERLLAGDRYPTRALLLTAPRLERLRPALERSRWDPRVHLVSQEVMDTVVGFPIHRGCLALGERGRPEALGALLERSRTVLVLLGLSNHDNVGSIFRSAAALGADAILLDDASADPLYRKAIRVSMGAAIDLPFVREQQDALWAALAQHGFARWALTPRPSAAPLQAGMAQPERLALILGTEGEGLPSAVISGAERALRIPMRAELDSLNVAVAGAIALAMLGRLP